MSIFGKSVETLTEEDIELLIREKVPESKHLDYKETFYIDDEKKKEEFLKDITAFYNTEGGSIIYGLSEIRSGRNKLGIPILPDNDRLTIVNYEQFISKICQAVSSGTNPKIANLTFSKLLDIKGRRVFAIGIPRNLSIPTMVTFNGSNTFHKRNNSDKYMPDTHELYRAFLSHQNMREIISTFIEHRKAQIFHPFSLELKDLPFISIHAIPLNYQDTLLVEGFGTNDFLKSAKELFQPFGFGQRQKYGYSYEGLFLLQDDDPKNPQYTFEGKQRGHILLFRNGIVESIINTPLHFDLSEKKHCSIYASQLGEYANTFVEQIFSYFKGLNIPIQFYLSLEINDLPESTILIDKNSVGYIKYPNLKFPSLLITGKEDKHHALSLIFDILWQTAGQPQCPADFKSQFAL